MSNATSRDLITVPIDNLSALAGKLQDAAQALLDFCRMPEDSMPNNSMHGDSDSASADTEGEEESAEEVPGGSGESAPLSEYRCYCLPPHILREEGEILERYAARDFAEAIGEIHTDLHVTTLLMKNFDVDEEVDGFTLQLIGQQLSRSLDMLSKVSSMFADFQLVRVSPNP